MFTSRPKPAAEHFCTKIFSKLRRGGSKRGAQLPVPASPLRVPKAPAACDFPLQTALTLTGRASPIWRARGFRSPLTPCRMTRRGRFWPRDVDVQWCPTRPLWVLSPITQAPPTTLRRFGAPLSRPLFVYLSGNRPRLAGVSVLVEPNLLGSNHPCPPWQHHLLILSLAISSPGG
jgi:hypothetical protein